MKFGIIGGIGPASTVDYYNGIITRYLAQFEAYPRLVIDSINMTEIINYFSQSDYNGVCQLLVSAIENLKNAGACYAAIASNTPHIVFDQLKEQSSLPLISIVEETCKFAAQNKYKSVLILGTRFTMKSGMYEKSFLKNNISALVPSQDDVESLHNIIFPNLENGIVLPEDKKKMIAISEHYISKYKVDAVVLGCTEIPLMIKENDLSVPTINTTEVHIEAIARLMIDEAKHKDCVV